MRVLWLWVRTHLWLSQHLFQGLPPFACPTVHGLPRDLVRTPHVTDQPSRGLCQQLADPVNALLSGAPMVLVSSLRPVVFLTSPPSLSGIFFVTFFVCCHRGSRSV
jgi:hypothetical protein